MKGAQTPPLGHANPLFFTCKSGANPVLVKYDMGANAATMALEPCCYHISGACEPRFGQI